MILVTGGTGLLGSRLLFDLATKGNRVRALRRANSTFANVDRYFSGHPQLAQLIEWVDGDVTDIFSLEDAIKGVSQVYHCAAVVSFQPSQRDKMIQGNISGTANVVNLCLEYHVDKLCFVSSIAALGRTGSENNIDENSGWKTSKHNSAYAISKYGAEREVWRGIAEGLNAVIVNPGVIIGPGNWKTDSSMLFHQVEKGLRFYTEGVNGFVDVRDVVQVMIGLMEGSITNERYIAVSESKAFKEVFDRIADKIGRPRASIQAGPLLAGIAWRAEYLKSLVTGSNPVITRETANSAMGKNYYSNAKVKNALDFEFIPVNDAIDAAAAEFIKRNK